MKMNIAFITKKTMDISTTTLHSSGKADTVQALKGLNKVAQGNALGHKRNLHFFALKGQNE
jgi:hypothetical protein